MTQSLRRQGESHPMRQLPRSCADPLRRGRPEFEILGWSRREERRTKVRHTYTGQPVQTDTERRMPRGERIWAPVSLLKVARELGHRAVNLVADVYGHLQAWPDRSTVVEYRQATVVPLMHSV